MITADPQPRVGRYDILTDMKKADIKILAKENAFDLIGKEWMLVTAGNQEKFNTMTASWGGIGWLWNKPV